MKLRMIPLMVGLALGLTAGNASADEMNKRMRDMFGGHGNVTEPGKVHGATRGVITGGNITVRTPIKSAPRFSFDPPTVTAGCGGFDLYGGNLSYPDKEQFIQMGRAIIGNLKGAAFQLAMEVVCAPCASVMEKVRDTVNDLNFTDMNSCQIAEQMASSVRNGTDPFAGISMPGRNIAAIWKEDAGMASDRGEAANLGRGKRSPTQDALSDPKMAEILQGNLLWDGLEYSSSLAWLGESRAVKEEILSIIGFVIMCADETEGVCPQTSDVGDPGVFVYGPTVSLADFAVLNGEGDDEHEIWGCGNDEDCLNPQRIKRTFKRTAAQLIVDAYLGKDGQPGLLDTSVMPATAETPDSAEEALEQAVLQSTGYLGSMVMQCVKQGELGRGNANFIVESMAPQVAAELLHTTLMQVIAELKQYVSLRSMALGAPRAMETLSEAEARLRAELGDIYVKTNRGDVLGTALQRCSQHVLAPSVYG